jgi:hypothetical protein
VRSRCRTEGAVTAEVAVAIPAVLLVLAACLGGLRVGVERIRVVDAAAQAARLAAIGEAPEGAAARVGAEVRGRTRSGETVCVVVGKTATVLGVPLPVEATSCALAGLRP